MNDKFSTEDEIEKYLERFHVTLRDSKGKSYLIEADRLTWHWFLTITTDEDFPAIGLMDDIIEWHKSKHPDKEISYIFSAYISYFVSKLGPRLKKQMLEKMKTVHVDDHPLFKNIDNSQTNER